MNRSALSVMRAAVVAGVLAAIVAGGAPGLASAEAAPTCAPTPGPYEYQSALLPLMHDPAPAPPMPPARAASLRSAGPTGGAIGAARDALGDQFTMVWFSNALQGWVVGVAPGPLDLAQARAAIVERLSARFSSADAALLESRLHVGAQLYRESELQATQAGVTGDLQAAALGVGWITSYGCQLSDVVRVEVQLFEGDSTPEIVERVRALLVPYGDRVRVAVLPGGPPTTLALPAIGPLPAAPSAAPIGRYVSMARTGRCVRAAQINIAVRREQRAAVALLTVRANGRRRTIGGALLRQPITVTLTPRRTSIVVAVKLRSGRRGERSVTFTRCG